MSNEINIEELEQSAGAVKGWRCDCLWTDMSDGVPVSVVGTIDEEGNRHPVVVFVDDNQCLCGDSGSLADFYAIENPNAILSLIDRLKKAEAELERERMRLAACGVVAMADTPESAADAQQERLLQDMHDAGREIDRVMAEADPKEPIAEQPVNTRLLTALKACRHQFAHYVAHHISKGDMHKAGTNDAMVAMADVAIMGAEAAPRVARLTMGECMQAVKHISFEEMTLFGIARAIEVAVLRKNGIEVAE